MYSFDLCLLLVTDGSCIAMSERLLLLFVTNLAFGYYSPLLLCSFVLFLSLSCDL